MNFNIFNSIILAGIVQGFVFSGVVFFSEKYRKAPVYFLSILILTFSLNNLQYYLQDTGLITSKTLFDYIWIPFQLIGGPMLLYYGLKLLHPEKPLAKWAKMIIIPFAIGLLLATYYKLHKAIFGDSDALTGFFWYVPGSVEFFSILLDQYIVIVLLREIQIVEKTERNFSLSVVRPELSWFRRILTVFLVASLAWLLVSLQTFIFGASEIWWYVIWIFMSFMIYWLGFVGINRYGVHEERRKILSYSIEKQIRYESGKPKNEHIVTLENILITQKCFLDPTLSLERLSEEMGLSKSHLSRVINTELGMGFNDYLNNLRVEEAKRHLCNPDFEQYTLVAIGLEAGFNSKTTFNTAFKKLTSMTPSEYRKKSILQFEPEAKSA